MSKTNTIRIKATVDKLKNDMNKKLGKLADETKNVRTTYTSMIKEVQHGCPHDDGSGSPCCTESEEDSTIRICKFCGAKV